MAYDRELADRVRAALGGEAVEERRMFGGLAFLVGGHLTVAVSGQDGIMVRIDPATTATLLAQPGVAEVAMGSRGPMKGWVMVQGAALASDSAVQAWVRRGLERVRGLPPK